MGVSYQWRNGTTNLTNGGNISGANSPTLTINPATAADVSGNYNVVVSSVCGSVTSYDVPLYVNPLPTATITPNPPQVCAGSTGNTASGPAGLSSYTWTITNGTITSGASSQTITYTAGASGNVTLTLTTTNANGCANSSSTSVTINANPAPPTITSTVPFAAPNSIGNQASGPASASSYAWTITNGTITSGANGQTVTYTAGPAGNVVLQLTVTNAAGCSASNSLTLPVNAPPMISKAFAPAYALPNTTTTLTFTITNPATNASAFTGVSFTDTFPNAPNLVVANPPNVVFNNCGGAVLTDAADGALEAGDVGIKLSGATVAVGTPCTVSVNVTPLAQGPFENVSGNVTALNGGMGNTATATLITNQAPQITAIPLTRKAGSQVVTTPIANVSDTEDTPNALTARINGGSGVTLNGITVSLLSITAGGQVQANVTTDCNALTTTFTLSITDSVGVTITTPWTVTIESNPGPLLAYNSPQTVVAGQLFTVNPAMGPSDNGAVASLAVHNVSPAFGNSITVNSSGVVSINAATPAGSYAVVIRATDQCGVFTDAPFTLNVTCPTLTVNPASLPGGQAGIAYNQTLSVSPAGGPYTFAVTNGALPSGLTLTAAGVLSGTPLVTGTFNFRVTATGYGTCTNFRDYILTIACPTFSIGALPVGAANSAYSQPLAVSPAAGAPFTFAHTGGTLPPGMTLTSAGLLSGIPTTSGTFNFTVTVTGFGAVCTTSVPASLTIGCPVITFNPATLPNGTQGATYNQTVAAAPAGGGYSYTVTAGALPPGLALDSANGVISGTAGSAGNYAFSIKATGWGGCSKTQSYNLLITGTCTSINLTPTTLPAGTTNTAYPSQTFTASGGTAPYTFNVTSGTLPPGLSLGSAGALTGTPTTSGTFSFTVRATAQSGCTGQRTYVVNINCGAITVNPVTLPMGVKGMAYSQTVSASPLGTYTYTLQLGGLPPGYTLNPSTGVLSGISNMAGTYNFTVKAQIGNCQGSRAYSIIITTNAAALAQKADYDGDGRNDFVLWSNTGAWRLLLSNHGNRQAQTQSWGTAGDLTLLGDYDGDGLTDLAVFRPSNGTWYIRKSGAANDGEYFVKTWGAATDVPVPGDYDGDGKTDLAVFRPSNGNWYIWRSSDQQYEITAWGAGYAPYLDVAVPGDYDGDGKTDLAVFRRATGTWLVKLSGNGQILTKQWGLGTDLPVAADYDGDGRTDCAIWRQSVWYIWQSATSSSRVETWGDSAPPYSDHALPADYDGDNLADVTIWRAATQTWYIICSQDGSLMTQPQGQTGDRPIAIRH